MLCSSCAITLTRKKADEPNVLPFGRLWYGEPDAIGYAKFYSRSHDAVIRVYDEAGNVIETHDHAGDLRSCETTRSSCSFRISVACSGPRFREFWQSTAVPGIKRGLSRSGVMNQHRAPSTASPHRCSRSRCQNTNIV
jgi:hypothetical protein